MEGAGSGRCGGVTLEELLQQLRVEGEVGSDEQPVGWLVAFGGILITGHGFSLARREEERGGTARLTKTGGYGVGTSCGGVEDASALLLKQTYTAPFGQLHEVAKVKAKPNNRL